MEKVTHEDFYNFFAKKENITTSAKANDEWHVFHRGELIAKSVVIDKVEQVEEYFIKE